ncbi:MAG: hypothetical protein V4697_00205 [Patescibacteria group bacterium]
MKKLLIIIGVIILLVAGYFAYMYWALGNDSLLHECPDEMIVNRMPGTEPQSSYYIKNGERKEIADYDASWVKNNCTVPTQEVF